MFTIKNEIIAFNNPSERVIITLLNFKSDGNIDIKYLFSLGQTEVDMSMALLNKKNVKKIFILPVFV